MARRPCRELLRRQHKAASLLEEGRAVEEVAKRLGVSPRTVRRWRRGLAPTEPQSPEPRTDVLGEMLRAEGPAVARVMLDLAKGGDVRAAALVVRLLGTTLTSAEEQDDGDSEGAFDDLEHELNSLPPEIVSEIVGLLAQAESAAASRGGGTGAAAHGRERGSVRLPWQETDSPSDEGAGSV
ncbi:MAG: helix-turn-helix domain-containing protein [Armatimonadetes bacterium]|nr:helix-turn-helix domain-containing protein [Armatimonadota bacterium]